MHKLDRSTNPAPLCLAEYDYLQHSWCDITSTHKQAVRRSLVKMQGERCAYCEGPPNSDGHIEHFRRKNPAHFPELTFEWDNLFFACGSQDHCGHYKDRPRAPQYNPDHLVKPDVHDPDQVFYFHSSGEVRARPKLVGDNAIRASETIRVFNLNSGALKAARRRAIQSYFKRDPHILDGLLAFDPQERQAFIAEEIEATRSDPYCTTIRHLFETVH